MATTNKTPVFIVAIVTAVCGLGDAMLFIVLPIYCQDFGLTALWQVGVLLSINRFIRLPINPWVGWYYSRMSMSSGMLLAVVLAMFTTFSYGWLQSFWLLLIMRCLWGVAWSFIRIGGFLIVIHTGTEENRGQLIGLYNGLGGLGGLIGMLAGGLMADLIGIRTVTNTFSVMALLTMPLVLKYIPPTPSVPQNEQISQDEERQVNIPLRKSPEVLAALCSGLLISLVIFGVFASTLSTMVSVQLSPTPVIFGVGVGVATLAGMIQAIRWGWDPFLAPLVGRLSDQKWGREPLLIVSLLGGALCLALIPFGVTIASLMFLFLCFQLMSTIMVTLNDSLAADAASHTSKVRVMTAYTVTVDMGSALGPLIGYFMIEWIGIYSLYWMTSGLLCLLGLFRYSQLAKVRRERQRSTSHRQHEG